MLSRTRFLPVQNCRRCNYCTVCSWWAPVMSEDLDAITKEFDAHVCADHPPLKNIEKPSPPNKSP
jgi:hypothetical protein